MYHALSNYITHLNEEGPRGLLAHKGALLGLENYQSVCGTFAVVPLIIVTTNQYRNKSL